MHEPAGGSPARPYPESATPELIEALRLLAYRQVSALLLAILVVLVDGLGSRLRQAMQ